MNYQDILENQKNNMPREIKWWTNFLYHFTDVHNASQILFEGWIYSRKQAIEKEIMVIDNASRAVIEATNTDNKCYGRLYFRPLTPTQFHNEGYKPEVLRNVDMNASCPVPIFLCLSSSATLEYPGTKIAEKGISGNRLEFNDPELRISKAEFPEVNITVNIDVIYKSTDGSILAASHGIQIFNYYNVRTCFYELKNDISYDVIRTTVHIDDAVMYENELNVKDILF